MSLFLVSIPILLIIISGWLFRKFKVIDDNSIHELNNFVYYVSLPALIINIFWKVDFLDQNAWELLFLSFVAIGLFFLIIFSLLSLLKINKNLKTAILLNTTIGNTIFMGFPFIELGLGSNFLPNAALVAAVFLIIPLVLTTTLIQPPHRQKKINLGNFLKSNFLIVSILIGILLSFVGIGNPLIAGVKSSLAMVGATAAPLALFALGSFLQKNPLSKNFKTALLASVLKVVAFPVGLFVFFGLFLEGENLEILLILSAMPVAATSFVVAEKFNLYKELTAGSILISTILSLLVTPLILYLF